MLRPRVLPVLAIGLAACVSPDSPTGPAVAPSFDVSGSPGQLVLCKSTGDPTLATFDFEVSATDNGVPGSGRFRLNATQSWETFEDCKVVWSSKAGSSADVTITEAAKLGWELWTIWGPEVGYVDPVDNSATFAMGPDVHTLVYFKNRPTHVDMAPGRMTGGGGQITIGDVRVTRGFTIHCDITLSNNVEVNWEGNRWHLDKPLTGAECIDDPAVDPAPPPAPFDTFFGEGVGRLNNVDGSIIRFMFVDAGEPGGRNDRATIDICAPGADPDVDAPVLSVDGFLDHGNLQAHFDQPHK